MQEVLFEGGGSLSELLDVRLLGCNEALGLLCAGIGCAHVLAVKVVSKSQGGPLSCFVLLLLRGLQLLLESFPLLTRLLERGGRVHARALCSCG